MSYLSEQFVANKTPVSVKDFGAKGDDVANDLAALQSAFSSSNFSIYYPFGIYKISTTGSLGNSGKVHIFSKEAILHVPAGVTLTIHGTIEAAPDQQIFQIDTDGYVILSDVIDVHPEWFGAAGTANYLHTDFKWYTDSTHTIEAGDDSAAIRKTIDSVAARGAAGLHTTIRFTKNHYLKTLQEGPSLPLNASPFFRLSSNTTFFGEGGSLRIGPGLQTSDYVIFLGTTDLTNVIFDGVKVNGNAQSGSATSQRNSIISMVGTHNNNITIQNCLFENHGGTVPVIISDFTSVNFDQLAKNVRIIGNTWQEIGNVAGLIDHISLYLQAEGALIADNVFFNDPATNFVSRNNGGAIQLQGVGVTISGNQFTNQSGAVLFCSFFGINSRDISMVGNTIELCSVAFSCCAAVGVTLSDISIIGNTAILTNDQQGQVEAFLQSTGPNGSDIGFDKFVISGNSIRYVHDARFADAQPIAFQFTTNIRSMIISDNFISGFPSGAIVVSPTTFSNPNNIPPQNVVTADLKIWDLKIQDNTIVDCGTVGTYVIHLVVDSTNTPIRRVQIFGNTLLSTGSAIANGINITGSGTDIDCDPSNNKFFNITTPITITPSSNGMTNAYEGARSVTIDDGTISNASITYNSAALSFTPGSFRLTKPFAMSNSMSLFGINSAGTVAYPLISLDVNDAVRISSVARVTALGPIATINNASVNDLVMHKSAALRFENNAQTAALVAIDSDSSDYIRAGFDVNVTGFKVYSAGNLSFQVDTTSVTIPSASGSIKIGGDDVFDRNSNVLRVGFNINTTATELYASGSLILQANSTALSITEGGLLRFVINSTGVNFTTPIAQFTNTVSSPIIRQDDLTTNGGTGATLTIQAQNETGTGSIGGELVLKGGTGTAAHASGGVTLFQGTTQIVRAENSTADGANFNNFLNVGVTGGLRGSNLISCATAGDAYYVSFTANLQLQSALSSAIIVSSVSSFVPTEALRIIPNGAGSTTIQFASTVAPFIKQADLTTSSGTGSALTIQAQNETGTTSTGGDLILQTGTGTSTDGTLRMKHGTTEFFFANSSAALFKTSVFYLQDASAQDAFVIGLNGTGSTSFFFGNGVTIPSIGQYQRVGTGANNGANLSVQAQQGQAQTGGANNNNGGNLILQSGPAGTGGSGTAGVAGIIQLTTGAVTVTMTDLSGTSLFQTTNFWFSATNLVQFTGGPMVFAGSTMDIKDTRNGNEVLSLPTVYDAAANIIAASTVPSFTIKQADLTTNSGIGATLTIQAQNETGTTSTGGDLLLKAGTGTSQGGTVQITGRGATYTFGQASHFGGTSNFIDVGGIGGLVGTSIVSGTTAGNAYYEANGGSVLLLADGAVSIYVGTPSTAGAVVVSSFATQSSVTYKIDDITTNSATGIVLTIQGQNATGTAATGGALHLISGTGTSASGNIDLINGSTTTLRVALGAVTAFGTMQATSYLINGNDVVDINSTTLRIGFNITTTATQFYAAGNERLQIGLNSIDFITNTTATAGGGSGVITIANAITTPTSDPSGGGILYVEGGALKWRGSGGSVTTIAAS